MSGVVFIIAVKSVVTGIWHSHFILPNAPLILGHMCFVAPLLCLWPAVEM
jgi:hypothetical protein